MPALISLLAVLGGSFRPRVALQAQILALRHQILALQRRNQKQRLRLSAADRLLWVWLSPMWTDWRSALRIVKPETVIAWHRKGFRLYWSWKSRDKVDRQSRWTAGTDSANEYRQPRLGCPADSRRTGKTRHQSLGDDSSQVHGTPPTPAIADLAHILGEPHQRSRLRRFLRGSDSHISAAVRVRHPFPWPPQADSLRGYPSSDCGVDGAATLAGASLGYGAAFSVARSRRQLRGDVSRRCPMARNRGSALCSALTLAECLCGTADRIDTPRMSGSCNRLARVRSQAGIAIVLWLLRSFTNSSITAQRRADSSPGPASRVRKSGRAAGSRRASSPQRTPRSLTGPTRNAVCFTSLDLYASSDGCAWSFADSDLQSEYMLLLRSGARGCY